MKKILIFLFLFIILLFVCFAQASEIDRASFTDKLFDEGMLQETVNLRISNNSLDSFLFWVPAGSLNVKVNSMLVVVINNSFSVPISCTVCDVNISYELQHAVSAVESGDSVFQHTVDLPFPVKLLDYELWLSEGHFVKGIGGEPPIVPVPSTISTDGSRIIIAWFEKNPELPKNYLVRFYGEEIVEVESNTFVNELSERPVWTLILISLILGFVIGILFYIYYRKRHHETDLPFIPSSLLTPDERAVLKVLKQNNNELNQKIVGKELSWSKSKVSAIMTGLEHKQIVSREKFGRNYKVTLQKEVELNNV